MDDDEETTTEDTSTDEGTSTDSTDTSDDDIQTDDISDGDDESDSDSDVSEEGTTTMTGKLVWDETGSRYYENGIDHGVLYLQDNTGSYGGGVVWNGITGVSESPEGAEANDLYADNIKYASLRSAETFKFTIEAYTYPDEFAECDGSASIVDGIYFGQQTRTSFGFSYRTQVGNDTGYTTEDDGYKLHIVYGCTASPSEKSYETINDSPDAITFSWEVDSTPITVDGYKAVSTVVIDSTKIDETILETIEETLYGTDTTEPTLILPDELIELISA